MMISDNPIVSSRTIVNQIRSIFNEMDSYKYGIPANIVCLMQASLLLFLKENCIDDNGNFSYDTEDAKSVWLRKVWEIVRPYWKEEENMFCQDAYRTLKMFGAPGELYKNVFDATIDGKGLISLDCGICTGSLAEFATRLLDYKGGPVYDPFAADGEFGRHLCAGDNFYGIVEDELIWQIGIIKYLMHDKLPSANYGPKKGEDMHTYDYIITAPDTKKDLRSRSHFEGIISNMSEKGKAVIVGPSMILHSLHSITKVGLLEENLIDSIILLPRKLLKNTGINAVIVTLRRGRQENTVKMMNATHDCYFTPGESIMDSSTLLIEKILEDFTAGVNVSECSCEEIATNDYCLDPRAYEFARIDIPEGYQVASLEELGERIRTTNLIVPKSCIMISASDLSSNPIDYEIDTSSIKTQSLEKIRRGYQLTTSCVLFGFSGGQLCAAYYRHHNGQEIYANTNLIPIIIRQDRILPEYLVHQIRLFDPKYGSGSTSPSLTMKIPILYPSLEDQRKIIDEATKSNIQAKIRELGLQKEIERLKDEYKVRIRIKKHNLGTLRNELTSSILLAKAVADDTLDGKPIDGDELYSYIDRLETLWSELNNRLEHIADENLFGPAEEFFFEDFIDEICKKRQKKFSISYDIDTHSFDECNADYSIFVNPDDFRQVVQNIKRNAIVHGFNQGRKDYWIKIHIRCDIESQMVVFEFTNNGTPAPSMTSEQFGAAGWHTDINGSKGEGLGGFYINEMTRNFGGGFTPPTTVTTAEESLTTVSVRFPAIIKIEEDE